MKPPQRLCIYPKDIARITGRSERYGRNLLNRIKEHYGKRDEQFVTTKEFCEYCGFNFEEVSKLITH